MSETSKVERRISSSRLGCSEIEKFIPFFSSLFTIILLVTLHYVIFWLNEFTLLAIAKVLHLAP